MANDQSRPTVREVREFFDAGLKQAPAKGSVNIHALAAQYEAVILAQQGSRTRPLRRASFHSRSSEKKVYF